MKVFGSTTFSTETTELKTLQDPRLKSLEIKMGRLPCFTGLALFASLLSALHAESAGFKECDDVEAFYADDDNSDEFEELGTSVIVSSGGVTEDDCRKFETFYKVDQKCVCESGSSKKAGTCFPDCKYPDMWYSIEKSSCLCPGNTSETESGCKCKRGEILVGGNCRPACEKNEVLNKLGECICAPNFTRLQGFENKCILNCPHKNMWRGSDGECQCPVGGFTDKESICRCKEGYHVEGNTCAKACTENEILNEKGKPGQGECECIDTYTRSPISNKCLPECRSEDMIRDKEDVCKCPGGSFETEEGCNCPAGYRFNKGGRCSKICGENEILQGAETDGMKCVCKDSCSRDPRFGNKCLLECEFPMMTRLDSSEKCRCPGYGLGYPKEAQKSAKGCSCGTGNILTESGCACPKNSFHTSNGGCKCKEGMELVNGSCKDACGENEVLNDNDQCVCAPNCSRIDIIDNKCLPNCQYTHMIRDLGGFCKCPTGASVQGKACTCKAGYHIDGNLCVETCAENEVLNGNSSDAECDCIESYTRSSMSNKCLPKCRFSDMVRDRQDVCKCPGGSIETSAGCSCEEGFRFNKGGRCSQICGDNEVQKVKSPTETSCACKENFTRDPRFGNKCLPDCEDKMMKRLDASEICRCPGYGLRSPREARKTSRGCKCSPGYLLTKHGCDAICAENQTFKSGRCECKVGYTKYRDICLPVCMNGKERTRNDKECRCRNGMVPQDGGCECEPDTIMLDGICEKRVPSSNSGHCCHKNTIASHYWGQYRPDMSKCSSGSTCEPSAKGYDCMTTADKKQYKAFRCGSCGLKNSPNSKTCTPIENRCKSGYTCSRRGRGFNCIEDSRCRIRNCGPCGQLSHSRSRCIKKQETTLQGSRVTTTNLCQRYSGKVCSPQMVNGIFPCVHKTEHIQVLLRAKGETPLNICRWSWARNRQTLFVTKHRREANAFKPPHKLVFMTYKSGVYQGSIEVLGSEGGWIYKHARGKLLKTTPKRSRRMGRYGFFGRRFRASSYIQPIASYSAVGATKISKTPRKNTGVC